MNTTLSRIAIVFLFTGFGLVTSPGTSDGAEIDLSSEFTDDTIYVDPGETAGFDVVYSNLGDFLPVGSYLNVDLPVGAFMDDPGFSVDMQDSLGNVGALYESSSCENLVVQLQGPGNDDDRPIPLDLPPHTTGVLTLSLEMPMEPVVDRTLRIPLPGQPPRKIPFSFGRCDDCTDLSTCLGPRVSTMVPAIEAKVTVVDDGSGSTGSLGCVSIKNDVAGTIALVRRGECEFGLKAMNAQIAGALACVVMNNDPTQDVTTISMPGGEFGHLVNIPVAIINNADADPIEAAIDTGYTPIGFLGGVENEELVFNSFIFHSGDTDQDPNPSNNTDILVVKMPFFSDGFESGDTSGWAATQP